MVQYEWRCVRYTNMKGTSLSLLLMKESLLFCREQSNLGIVKTQFRLEIFFFSLLTSLIPYYPWYSAILLIGLATVFILQILKEKRKEKRCFDFLSVPEHISFHVINHPEFSVSSSTSSYFNLYLISSLLSCLKYTGLYGLCQRL